MTDLTDRMRTCAAAIIAVDPKSGWVALVEHDAANLLIEASNALEAIPPPLGEPMEIIEPLPPSPILPDAVEDSARRQVGLIIKREGNVTDIVNAMTDPGVPTDIVRSERNPRACPKCDSRSAKRVYRDGKRLMLQCPACSTAWQYKFEATWG